MEHNGTLRQQYKYCMAENVPEPASSTS